MQRRTDKQTSSQKLSAAAGIKLNGGCRPLLKGLYVTLLSPNLSFAGAGRAGRGWCFTGDVRCSDWYASEALRDHWQDVGTQQHASLVKILVRFLYELLFIYIWTIYLYCKCLKLNKHINKQSNKKERKKGSRTLQYLACAWHAQESESIKFIALITARCKGIIKSHYRSTSELVSFLWFSYDFTVWLLH